MGLDADFGLEADKDFSVIGRCVWIQRPPPDNWPRTQLEEVGARSEGACDGDECARHESMQRRESVACFHGVYRRHHRITTGHEMTCDTDGFDLSRHRKSNPTGHENATSCR